MLKDVYPNLRMNKAEYKELVLSCMVRNEPTIAENGESIEPLEKIDSEKSKENLLKEIISFVITSLTYERSLLSLCLLSIMKEV